MAAVFLKLLNLSISASWLVLAVLVLRLVSKRSPKWMNVLLWGIVALRLVLPFSIESALSLIPSAETVSPVAVQSAPAPTITSGVSVIDNAVNPSLSEHFAAVPTASVNPLYVWTEIAGWVWLIGLGAMLLYALASYLRLRRRVSVSLPIQDNIYLCDAISSPFILGVVKPRIYLPSGLDEVQRQNVLSHERAHLARRDHWWKPLGFALLAVYWFNPVLWLAYTLLCRDIELACDERVIRTMDESAVKTYSTVLLACSMPRKAVITCPLAFGEVGVKERVRNALHYKKPAFWVVAASVAVCVVVAVCFLTNPPTDTDAAGLVGFHREQVTYADVTDASGAQPSNVQLTAEETDAVYALLDALQYKRLGAASAMEDCYARLYFISAAGERCEIMLSEREMLVNPITGGKTARLYELRSGSTELRDYLFGCIGASEPAEEEMKTMTEPTLSLTLTVPAAWEDIAELSACDKGTTYLGYGIMLFHLSEKNALAAYPDGGMGNVWWLVAMSWDNFKEWRGYDALPVPEILGIAEYVLGADDEYVYLLVLPSDVQWLENDPVSKAQYEQLCADSQEVLERFLNDNGIVLNEKCPDSRVFSAEKMLQEDAARDYISYLSGSIDLASAKKGSLLHCEFPGMSALTAALPLEDSEREAVLKWANTEKVDSTTRIDYYAAIAVRQHYLVLEQFGDNAWENVSYTFEKIDPVDGALGYRIIETGESIGAAEYDKILREYWDDVAKKEGVDYYDIFLPEAEPPEKMADKRVDLIAKYSEGIPVELTTISDAQAYRVNLSFNGKKTSAQGFGDFHFIIDNRTGEWKAYEGLTWAEPYPRFPIGD